MGMLREVFDTNVAKDDRRAVPALRGRVPLRPETATLVTMFQGRRCGYLNSAYSAAARPGMRGALARTSASTCDSNRAKFLLNIATRSAAILS